MPENGIDMGNGRGCREMPGFIVEEGKGEYCRDFLGLPESGRNEGRGVVVLNH